MSAHNDGHPSSLPPVDPSLGHATALFQDKIGELSLIRELSDCGAFLTDPESLAGAVTSAIQSALQIDACALFEPEEGGDWRYAGGISLSPKDVPPDTVTPNLLDLASRSSDGVAMTGVAMTGVENDHGLPQQVAVSLTQNDRHVGFLVLTDAEAGHIWAERRDMLVIVRRLLSTLLYAAQMYRQVEDSKQHLEDTLIERTRHLKETQERLHQQEKLASLGQLITGVSHELNNRLVPILGYSQLLKEESLKGSVGKAVSAIEVAALGSKRIVDDLLSFARPSKPSRIPVDLGALLEEVKAAISAGCDAPPPITISTEGEIPQVMVDPCQAEQMFHNLLKNALEALGGRENGHIRVGMRADNERVQIDVEDNGSGMSDTVQARIFDPFYSTKGVGKGTGLGLSITHGLVSANGGTIKVESRNGFGSRFTLTFPMENNSPAVDRTEPERNDVSNKYKVKHEVSGRTSFIRKKLLVVDDESGIREFLTQALGREFDVETAEDGLDAQHRLEDDDFDLVLMDMRMPGQGGESLYRWISGNRPETAPHVIFMTGDLYGPEANASLDLSLITISEPTRLRRISYAVYCLKKNNIPRAKQHKAPIIRNKHHT